MKEIEPVPTEKKRLNFRNIQNWKHILEISDYQNSDPRLTKNMFLNLIFLHMCKVYDGDFFWKN